MKLYRQLLAPLISFQSISTDENFLPQTQATAEWLNTTFAQNGFESQKISNYGNDIVLAKYVVDSAKPTVLIYGHYDVQPATQDEGWDSDPFTVVEKDGKLYARGIVDNKGQVLIHMATAFELIKEKKLQYNLIFMVEGNEETGSPKLEDFVKDHQDKLQCDFVLFSDGELSMGHPIVETGFRGVMNIQLKLKTSSKDNHSGLYGGSIPNAAQVLTSLLATMHDQRGVLNLPGLTNSLEHLSQDVIDENQAIPFNEQELLHNTGAQQRLDNGTNFYLQNSFLTSAEVTTLSAGYQGVGFRNAIPGAALAKINFRIAPQHSCDQVLTAFTAFLEKNTPAYASFELSQNESAEAISLDPNNQFADKAKKVALTVYQKECFYKFCGAIVPISGIFKDLLHVPVVSIGLGNEDCNMHGANENFDVELIQKGLDFSREFLGE